ncbi:MAG UNVERIFIED_CONTAM: hypothetical protein LVT10_01760 [Anaerolineae bacterium]|jgi:formate hydrogenlyase subunit 3/multisubunit Na+/H+ antiporter MnhD subunit
MDQIFLLFTVFSPIIGAIVALIASRSNVLQRWIGLLSSVVALMFATLVLACQLGRRHPSLPHGRMVAPVWDRLGGGHALQHVRVHGSKRDGGGVLVRLFQS